MTNVEFFKKFYLKILVQCVCSALLIQGKFLINLHNFEYSLIKLSAIAYFAFKFLHGSSGLLNISIFFFNMKEK